MRSSKQNTSIGADQTGPRSRRPDIGDFFADLDDNVSARLRHHVQRYAADVQEGKRPLTMASVRRYLKLQAFGGDLAMMAPPTRVFLEWVKLDLNYAAHLPAQPKP